MYQRKKWGTNNDSTNIIYIKPITKTSLFKYTETFTTKKWKFSDKNSDIFHISAQNIYSSSLFVLPHHENMPV